MFQLRPFQKQALALLEASTFTTQHLICVAPTGSGKSLIYESFASQQGRKTLLITPLIALARQQLQKLQKLNIPTFMSAGGNKQFPKAHQSGAWIMSPELLQYPSTQISLSSWQPEFLVVDECHCLWEWGEDFRPAFLKIPDILKLSSVRKSLWLTATLPPAARTQLRSFFPVPPTEIGEFNLPESIFLEIRRVAPEDRLQALISWIQEQAGSGIIFVSTRDLTLRLCRVFTALGRKTTLYHAGLSVEERLIVEKMIQDQKVELIIATSAFGMGMDYPHLNFIALWQAPTSLLSLVQTIGRVGRSKSTTANALVFWDLDDFLLLEWTTGGSETRRAEFKNLLNFLQAHSCRRAGLRQHFDTDPLLSRCEKCDICAGNPI